MSDPNLPKNNKVIDDNVNLKNITSNEINVSSTGGNVFIKGRYSINGPKKQKDKQLTQK